MRGQDVEAEISLTLEEAHRGFTRSLNFQTIQPCPDCRGSGSKDDKVCPTCRGSGAIRRPKSFDVNIPAGVRDGSVIRLAGQGEPGTNRASAGDLFLHVRIEPHRLFHLVGLDDVQVELPVAPWEAVLGAKVHVPTLDEPVEMKIPAGAQGGQRLRLRGQGLKRRGEGRGDQYVKLKIVIPPELTAKEKDHFEKLAAESHFNARELMTGR
jgi:curved DNA-binding protein